MFYKPPTIDDLRTLKEELGFTGEQMAELCGLAGGQQWRKYTGGQEPREISPQMLFFAAARLELDAEALERVANRMRAIGAELDGVCRARPSIGFAEMVAPCE